MKALSLFFAGYWFEAALSHGFGNGPTPWQVCAVLALANAAFAIFKWADEGRQEG